MTTRPPPPSNGMVSNATLAKIAAWICKFCDNNNDSGTMNCNKCFASFDQQHLDFPPLLNSLGQNIILPDDSPYKELQGSDVQGDTSESTDTEMGLDPSFFRLSSRPVPNPYASSNISKELQHLINASNTLTTQIQAQEQLLLNQAAKQATKEILAKKELEKKQKQESEKTVIYRIVVSCKGKNKGFKINSKTPLSTLEDIVSKRFGLNYRCILLEKTSQGKPGEPATSLVANGQYFLEPLASRFSSILDDKDEFDHLDESNNKGKRPPPITRAYTTDPPLISGWIKSKTKEGKVYYENRQTRQSRWDPPFANPSDLRGRTHSPPRKTNRAISPPAGIRALSPPPFKEPQSPPFKGNKGLGKPPYGPIYVPGGLESEEKDLEHLKQLLGLRDDIVQHSPLMDIGINALGMPISNLAFTDPNSNNSFGAVSPPPRNFSPEIIDETDEAALIAIGSGALSGITDNLDPTSVNSLARIGKYNSPSLIQPEPQRPVASNLPKPSNSNDPTPGIAVWGMPRVQNISAYDRGTQRLYEDTPILHQDKLVPIGTAAIAVCPKGLIVTEQNEPELRKQKKPRFSTEVVEIMRSRFKVKIGRSSHRQLPLRGCMKATSQVYEEEEKRRIENERRARNRHFIKVLEQGGLFFHFTDKGTPIKQWLQVNEHGDELRWGNSKGKMKNKMLVADISDMLYGPFQFSKKYNWRKGKPWLCFTLIFDKKQMNIMCQNESQVTSWYIGLQELMPLSAYNIPLGVLLWRRCAMRLAQKVNRGQRESYCRRILSDARRQLSQGFTKWLEADCLDQTSKQQIVKRQKSISKGKKGR